MSCNLSQYTEKVPAFTERWFDSAEERTTLDTIFAKKNGEPITDAELILLASECKILADESMLCDELFPQFMNRLYPTLKATGTVLAIPAVSLKVLKQRAAEGDSDSSEALNKLTEYQNIGIARVYGSPDDTDVPDTILSVFISQRNKSRFLLLTQETDMIKDIRELNERTPGKTRIMTAGLNDCGELFFYNDEDNDEEEQNDVSSESLESSEANEEHDVQVSESSSEQD